MQNTNVKARRLLAGDIQRQMNILAAHFQKWVAAVTSKAEPRRRRGRSAQDAV